MLDRRDFGLVLYRATYELAMDRLIEMFSDPGFDDAFQLLPETALGTALSLPDGCGFICRTIFPYAAAIASRPVEMTAEEMAEAHSEEIGERFW